MSSPHRIKARRNLAWFLLLLTGFPFLLLALIEPEKQVFAWGFFGFALLLCALAWFVFGKMWIEWDEQELRLHHVFRTERLPWREITASSTEWQPQGADTFSFNWDFHMADGRTRFIQLGYYSRRDMQLLARTLVKQAPQAQIGSGVKAFVEGRFPWYLR